MLVIYQSIPLSVEPCWNWLLLGIAVKEPSCVDLETNFEYQIKKGYDVEIYVLKLGEKHLQSNTLIWQPHLNLNWKRKYTFRNYLFPFRLYQHNNCFLNL